MRLQTICTSDLPRSSSVADRKHVHVRDGHASQASNIAAISIDELGQLIRSCTYPSSMDAQGQK
jgi:hypothetical protein